MAELVIQSGKHRGKKLVLPPGDVVIGRDQTCQIQMATSEVSRQHCVLRSTPEGLVVRDLGSRNGTFLNDVAVEKETAMKPGDVLRVGPMIFQVPPAKEVPQGESEPLSQAAGEPKSATDEEIVSWLADDDADQDSVSHDTAIVRRKPEKKKQPAVAGVSEKKEFKSIAEEAADIIRRHWELTQNEDENR